MHALQGWNTSIRNISVDFIEKDSRGIITVGVAAIVRVTLKDGCFHEDCGSVLSPTFLPARVLAFTFSHVPSLARTRFVPVGCYGRSTVLAFATLSIGKHRPRTAVFLAVKCRHSFVSAVCCQPQCTTFALVKGARSSPRST
jgi:hypothetical protein